MNCRDQLYNQEDCHESANRLVVRLNILYGQANAQSQLA